MMPESDRKTEHTAEWVYSGVWQVLSGWFRVPQTPPTLPVAAGEQPDAFKLAAGYIRYLKFWFWIVSILVGLAILIGWVALTIAVWWLGLLLAVPALLLAVVPGIVGYVAIHLRYDTTWYVMTERSLRIRRGIWVIHEMTFTFENVQNVKVQQGPLQRLFGVSDLIVETAGSGGNPSGQGGPALNRGVVEGVTDAWALRDRVLARLKSSQSAGFGDEDDVAETGAGKTGPGWTAEHIQALRSIRDELVLLGE
jgi:membrane protein YdbS with pleckstrin-like domain